MRHELTINRIPVVNVDQIESLRLSQGWLCAMYPGPECQLTNGRPRYVDATRGEKQINDVGFEIWSMECQLLSKTSHRSIAARAEHIEQSRTALEAVDAPLDVCLDVNMSGVCYASTPDDSCKNNPLEANAVKSIRLAQGWTCAIYSERECQSPYGPPYLVDAKYKEQQINDVTFPTRSFICEHSSPKAARTIDAAAAAPGDTTICDGPNFFVCTDNMSAMNRCSSFDPAAGGPESLKQARGAVCKWFRGYGCGIESKDDQPLKLDSRGGAIEMASLGADGDRIKSVSCKTGDW